MQNRYMYYKLVKKSNKYSIWKSFRGIYKVKASFNLAALPITTTAAFTQGFLLKGANVVWFHYNSKLNKIQYCI